MCFETTRLVLIRITNCSVWPDKLDGCQANAQYKPEIKVTKLPVDERHKTFLAWIDLGRVFREDFLLFYHPCLTTLDQEGSSQVTKRPGKHCKERKRRHNNNPSSSGVIVANDVVKKKSFHTFLRAARLFLCFHLWEKQVELFRRAVAPNIEHLTAT